ncbi:uncharacterized protein LOC122306236 [Carya illinoinensis]|uniref:uncharacterized protein LOC122306236 n=1 Tax=Carya illinoinensis TaxID=32201 RepID=UPI001C726596|nr:uncharacterized protein LOC122306236 [Carya illinoinensis]
MCEAEEETIMHVLWECPAANNLWGNDESCVKKWVRSESNFMSLWEKLMDRLAKNQLEEMTILLRKVWLRRNDWIFEKIMACPKNSFSATKAALHEFRDSQVALTQRGAVQKTNTEMVRWEKPERGYVKVNWDASMDLKGKRMGIGIMIRDEQGETMVTVCDQKPNMVEAAVAESLALRKAAEICSELNIQRAIFEGNAKVVILVVNGDEDACFNFSPIVEDIRFYLSNRPNWSIQFVPKANNMVAHSLAKKAIVMEEERVWIEEVPDFIVGVLNSDKDVIQKV